MHVYCVKDKAGLRQESDGEVLVASNASSEDSSEEVQESSVFEDVVLNANRSSTMSRTDEIRFESQQWNRRLVLLYVQLLGLRILFESCVICTHCL